MTKKHDMTTPDMTRVTVRVPRTTLDQINEWVDSLGVRRSHFLGIALVAGVRSLIRASALEPSLEAKSSQSEADQPDASIEPRSGELEPDGSELGQIVASLRSEIASLRAQVAELREQPRN